MDWLFFVGLIGGGLYIVVCWLSRVDWWLFLLAVVCWLLVVDCLVNRLLC